MLLQWRGNAYRAEWSGTSDEPAHYIGGLAVRDYVAAGFPTHPMQFAAEFYNHYPKLGIGHWPPVFYAVEGAWMLLFGTSRISLLLLLALISTCLVTLAAWISARYFPMWAMLSGALFLVTVAGMQIFTRNIAPDLLMALLSLLAIQALARHLEEPTWRTGISFGLLASLALLTKATAILLAPLPVLGVAVLGRWRLLRTAAFWSPALMVLALTLPWFLLAPDGLHQSVALFGGVQFRWSRPLQSVRYWLLMLGPWGAGLAAFGLFHAFRERRFKADPLWALLLLAPLVAMAFRAFIGAWEAFYLVAALPCLIPFLCFGLVHLVRMPWVPKPLGVLCAVLLIAVGSWRNVESAPAKRTLGLEAAALRITTDPLLRNAHVLVVSDSVGEGVLIAEIARREVRPGHVIERSTKVLAESGFLGDHYRLRYQTPAALLNFLASKPRLLVVADSPGRQFPHSKLLQETISSAPERWNLVAAFPRQNEHHSGEVRLFTLR